jgi:hypothetical protein
MTILDMPTLPALIFLGASVVCVALALAVRPRVKPDSVKRRAVK